MAERGYADITEALFEEFGTRLSLPTITAVLVQHRLRLHGATRVVDPTELEHDARTTLLELIHTTAPDVGDGVRRAPSGSSAPEWSPSGTPR